MGSNANAEIIYGFPFEGDLDDEAYLLEPEIWLAAHQGLPKPGGDDNSDAHRAYYEACKTLPINITCDGDLGSGHTMTYLVIREAQLTGDWCDGTKIPVGHVKTPPPEWDELLRKFCEKAGVSFQQPEWLLLASCG